MDRSGVARTPVADQHKWVKRTPERGRSSRRRGRITRRRLFIMKTEENKRTLTYKNHQKRVSVGGEKIWADPALIPLLRALNNAGLKTRSHCAGHAAKHPRAFVAIRMDSETRLEVRNDGPYREVVLSWQR